MKIANHESSENKGRPYREGELDLILSLPPTKENIKRLANSLGRSEDAIKIVYRIAYRPNEPFGKNADIQVKKIIIAKKRAGFVL